MNSWHIALLAAILGGIDGMELPDLWRGWDNYQVIMWSTGSPRDISLWFKRLAEMECTAEECYRGRNSEPFVQHGLQWSMI